MSHLVVAVTNCAKLEYRLGNLIIRDEGYRSICLDDLSVLIIESTAVSLTAALVSALIKKKIKLIFCDEKRNPSGELVAYYGCHDSSAKLRRQLQWTEEAKERVGRELIKEKIRKQAQILQKLQLDTEPSLADLALDVQPWDRTCREAHAARLYFQALFGQDFNRVRSDPINACLNYGYSLLLSMISRKVVAAGYLTQLGLYHRNEANHYNFSCDLVEPWRPLVDLRVKAMRPRRLGKEEKAALLNLFSQHVQIAGQKRRLEQALDCYLHSVFRALEEDDLGQLRFFDLP